MALRTTTDIIAEVLIRNNRTTTDAFLTDTTLQGWLKDAHVWAAGCKKWPMTEGRVSTTYTGSITDDNGDVIMEYPEAWRSDSIRRVEINGKNYQKTNFYDYRRFREENPSDSKKLFTDFARRIYINPNAGPSGTVWSFGQYVPTIDVTDDTAVTIFSTYDEDANEALVEKMTSYLKRREHLPNEAELHDQRAAAKLEELWKKITDEQYGYETTDGEGMFKRLDILRGVNNDDSLRRDRFY